MKTLTLLSGAFLWEFMTSSGQQTFYMRRNTFDELWSLGFSLRYPYNKSYSIFISAHRHSRPFSFKCIGIMPVELRDRHLITFLVRRDKNRSSDTNRFRILHLKNFIAIWSNFDGASIPDNRTEIWKLNYIPPHTNRKPFPCLAASLHITGRVGNCVRLL